MPKLIILDLYGTLIKSDLRDRVVRPGLLNFLDYYSDTKKVVFSDANPDAVQFDLMEIGLDKKFDCIYGSDYCIYPDLAGFPRANLRAKLQYIRGCAIKHLTCACNDFLISKEETIFIGDNSSGVDRASAEICEIPFIQVPQFRDMLPRKGVFLKTSRGVKYDDPHNPFNFESLIGKL